MKITKVTKRNILFTVPENNEGGYVHMGVILGEKNNYIVDTGMGESNVKAMLEYIGNDTKPIIVIITHAHWDHFLGNSALKDRVIVSHKLCRETMEEEWETKTQERITANQDFIDPEITKCLPNLVFSDCLHFPEDGVSIFHTPGHTDNDISIYDAVSKILYIGDSFGALDGKAYFWTRDKKEAEQLLEIYKQYDFEICIPSHCEPQTRDVIAYLETSLVRDFDN